MKKILTFICFCLLITSTAFSNPLADNYPEQALAAICLGAEDAKYFFNLTGEETETTKVSKEIVSCLKNRLGIDIENEIEQIGFFLFTQEDKKGANGLIFITGNFNPQNISNFAKKMISAQKDSLKPGTVQINGQKVQSLVSKDSRIIFYSKNMLLYCPKSTAPLFESNKLTFSKAPQSIIDLMERSKSFIYLGKEAKEHIPPQTINSVEGLNDLESIAAYYKNSCFYLEAGFNKEDSAKAFLNFVENLKKNVYKAKSTDYERAMEDLKHSSIHSLADDIEKVLSSAKTMDFIDEMQISRENTSLVLAQPLEEQNKSMFVIGGIGVLAAAAIPNFKRARESAREKACFSNIRVLQGAVEMYNLDNETMMESLEIDKLVKGKYLRDVPQGPEPDCEYYSDGNLTNDGEVACRRHGKLPR